LREHLREQIRFAKGFRRNDDGPRLRDSPLLLAHSPAESQQRSEQHVRSHPEATRARASRSRT
jgi:hypothetical protein